MPQIYELFTSDLGRLVEGVAITAFGAISAYQLIRLKLHAPKCVICGNSVPHDEQARDLSAPCHEHCYFVATLMNRSTS